jgi:hypothetical protein
LGLMSMTSPEETSSLSVVATLCLFIGGLFYTVVLNAQYYVLANSTNISVSQALNQAAHRWLPFIGHTLVLGLMALPFMIAFAVAGMTAFFQGYDTLQSPEAINELSKSLSGLVVVGIILLPFYVYFMVRLGFAVSLTILAEGGGTFRQSWALTRGRFWRILWMYILYGLTIGILSIAVQTGVGIIALQLPEGIHTMLNTIIQGVFMILGFGFNASILRRLQRS